MIQVTEAHINGLLLRKRIALARRNLLDYAKLVFPRYQINWHHRDLAYHLEAVESGELTRLEVSMPPRHGKSLLCSIIFPCWVLGRQPGIRIAQCAYAATLAETHSRHARTIVLRPSTERIGPVTATDSTATATMNTHPMTHTAPLIATSQRVTVIVERFADRVGLSRRMRRPQLWQK